MVFKEGDPKNNLYPHIRDYTSFLKKMERPLVGREKEMQSLLAAMARPELCNAILLAEAGSGKALADDTLIPVADERGYVPISEIRVGDMVFDERGEPVRVDGVFPQGMKHAYLFRQVDGSEVVCNDEHLWNARTRNQHYTGSEYSTLTLAQMMAAGFRAPINGVDNVKQWYVPVASAVNRKPMDYGVHPYVMGVLVSDGCLSSVQCAGDLKISVPDKPIVERVAQLIGADGFEKAPNRKQSWRFFRRTSGGGTEYVQAQEIFDLCYADSVFGQGRAGKTIPYEYLIGSVEQRMELLRGLMDCDGTISGNDRLNCSFHTSNEELGENVVELLASLGMRATLTVNDRKDGIHFNPEYRVHISIPDEGKESVFWLERHKKKFRKHRRFDKKFTRHFDDIAIDSVEDLGTDMPMTCIHVESESHLFLCTENYVVTHNTALVQGTMLKDGARAYLEVDLPKMISNLKNENEMADKLKQLFREVEAFRKAEGKEIVLFIDEFHQIVQLSSAAVEVLKPLLADSGTRGIHVIAATTYIEFQDYIASNLPLVERLQRINLAPPGKDVVVNILRTMAEKYEVGNQFLGDGMFEAIYDYTNRYIPSTAQPRKSILMLDTMIGWHRLTGKPMDIKMLSDVIYETEGINIAFRVDAKSVKKRLDAKVLSQDFATKTIADRLQICVADLNNKGRPMSSFLFTGSTGTGKGLVNEEIIPVWTPDGSVSEKRNGDIEIGDFVFNRRGEPVRVVGVFPQGLKDIYKVTLTDGRTIETDGSHLWTYLYSKGKYSSNTYTNSTKEIYERGVYVEDKSGRHKLKYWIPMNGPVQYPEADLKVHPYVMGVFIGDGCLTIRQLTLSSDDSEIAERVARLLGNCTARRCGRRSFNWVFDIIDFDKEGPELFKAVRTKQAKHVFGDYPEVLNKKAPEKRIPSAYMHASIEQRWELVRGLFDTDGSIGSKDGGRYNVSFSSTSLGLIQDLQNLLYSLGVASTYTISRNLDTGNGKYIQYELHVKSSNMNKGRFFWVPRKVEIAKRAAEFGAKGSMAKRKEYDWVGIADIELLPEKKETTCIYVDDDEHLYQAGQFIVTHNTEVSKQLANILFEDDRALVRMDMTEYSMPESLERFRQELTTAVWTRPYCIVLLDEIEKACGQVTRLLLQVLDDGRLLDRNNREVTFRNAYIIITTNAGSEIYKTIAQYEVDDTGSGKLMEKYEALIRDSIKSTTGGNRFPPELLGRIDCLVPFQPLSEKTMALICQMRLNELRDRVRKIHGMDLHFDRKVIRYIVQDRMTTDSDAGGARGIVSRIEREVTVEVAKYINTDPGARRGRAIYVCVEGEMAVDDKNRKDSAARIVVVDKPLGEMLQPKR